MNNIGTVQLETDRILLRRFKEDDYISMYHNWAKHEACSLYFPWAPVSDISIARERMKCWVECYKENNFYQWGIELKDNNELIGIINLHNIDECNNSAETSYILSPRYWRKGIMTEALKKILKFAFVNVELNRIQADLFDGNEASKKVMVKCGMISEGVNREKYFKNGKYIDSIQFAIIKRDFKNE